MLNFNIRLRGAEKTAKNLGRLKNRVKDVMFLWKDVAKVFYRSMRLQFRTEGAAGIGKWADLKPSYANWKERNFPGMPILQRSGELLASLTDPAHELAVYKPKKEVVQIGTRHPAMTFHHRGTKFMPARQLVLRAKDKIDIAKIMGKGMAKEIIKMGFRRTTPRRKK